MNKSMTGKERIANILYYVVRVATLLSVVMVFFPGFNPGKISGLINKNMSLFTTAITYDKLVENCVRAFSKGWVSETSFQILFVSCMIIVIGIIGMLMAIINYPIYKAILSSRRKKHADKIIAVSDKIIKA